MHLSIEWFKGLCDIIVKDMPKDINNMRIGISSCLLGNPVRYDGGHKKNLFIIRQMDGIARLVPICPEVDCGLSVPREPMRLEGNAAPGFAGPRLVTIDTGADHTGRILAWAKDRIGGLEDIRGFIFKARSPSCAPGGADIYDNDGSLISSGPGLFARVFIERFPDVPVIDEQMFRDASLRKGFVDKAHTLKAHLLGREKGGRPFINKKPASR